MKHLLFYCRSGFENDLAAEIMQKSSEFKRFGYVSSKSAYVLFTPQNEEDADFLAQNLAFKRFIFARQIIVVDDLLTNLPLENRISPLIAQWKKNQSLQDISDIFVEFSDNNEGRELSVFCRKFTVPLRRELKNNFKFNECANKRLHAFFIDSKSAYIGYSYVNNSSDYLNGIPRLKFPVDAPSRSTLKLEEALLTFIPKNEIQKRLHESMQVVDLGACPGGWTYQMVRRGMHVYAIDHGKIAESLLKTKQVTHIAGDGFKYLPEKYNKIYWLLCDMVEQPKKVISLMIKWLVNGLCTEAIFNLKLPMKKRFQEIDLSLSQLEEALQEQKISYILQAKQLYHDREEVTIHVQLLE